MSLKRNDSTNKPEVIDLVSSDEENEAPASYATVVVAGKKKRSRMDASLLHNHDGSLRKGHVMNKKLQHQQIKQQCPSCMPFINADVSDNAIVTDDWMPLLANLSVSKRSSGIVLTCARQYPSPASDTPLLHVQQQDKWSCGYRNLQMLLVVLLPLLQDSHAYHSTVPASLSIPSQQELFRSIPIPSLHQLQTFLETSWTYGFDERGAQHYHHQIVGKSCFIGAIEVSTILSYLHMDNVVIQFIKVPESKALLAPFVWNYYCPQEPCLQCRLNQHHGHYVQSCATFAQELLQRSELYGTNISTPSSCSCPIPPLYLQWQGHSATIVGVERLKSGLVNFLLLDPLKNGHKLKQALQNSKVIPGMMVLSSKALIQKDIQVVMANSPRPLTVPERNTIRLDGNVVTAAAEAVRIWQSQQE